ncbi:MAG: RecQ family ATP-dependent DNA helicase [Ignavibacteria bacterium]|jgi:ATP-dependent DNA helicase RecQ|nr:RecQ family ATP-dependent DNA helicase [Ignavibacteria bacterium]
MQQYLEPLEQYFGYKTFRPGQAEIIDTIMSQRDTLVVMPTGGGKSLCYQLPALLLPGTAIVVSPLIALMHDQYTALIRNEYPATYINSSLSFEEYNERLDGAILGKYKLLYIAPERLNNEYFIKQLRLLNISFLAVDEAHCISEWGHDFRPAYLNIANALLNINVPHIVALTATATPDVQEDIVESLKMKETQMFITGFNRANLSFITENTSKKTERISQIVKETQVGSTIIYCGSRKKTEQHHKDLIEQGIQATFYHAGLTAEQRKQNQDAFIDGSIPNIVATNAFGLGIDKADVRNVIHTDLTGSIEQYYQEAGRAGRDGLPSNCYLLYTYADRNLQDFFIDAQFPQNDDFDAVYQYLYSDGKMYPLDYQYIAKQVHLNESKVHTIIGYFEKVGVLIRYKQEVGAKILLKQSKEQLAEFILSTNESKRIALDAIIRSYSDDAIGKVQDINVEEIASKYAIPVKTFLKALREITKQGVIEFQDTIPSGTIVVYKEMSDILSIGIDFAKLNRRRSHSQQKLDRVLEYVSTNDCKRNYILDYFNDKSYSGRCGKCSGCLDTQQVSEEMSDDMETVLLAAAELNGRFGQTTLVDFLKGNTKNAMLEKYNLKSYKYYRFLTHLPIGAIYKMVHLATDAGYLDKSNGTYPLVTITQIGLEKVGGKTTPPKENLLVKSSSLRTRPAIPQPKEKGSLTPVPAPPRRGGEHLKEPPQYPTPDKFASAIDDLFRSGYRIEEVAARLNTNNGKIGEVIQMAIERKQITNYTPYINSLLYNKIKEVVNTHPNIILRDIQPHLNSPINYALLRIIVAFVRNE